MSIAVTDEVHAEIDRQIYLLHRTRSVFPRLEQELVGQQEFESPDYYKRLGFKASFEVPEGISQEFVDGFFEVGHWINENFLLRPVGGARIAEERWKHDQDRQDTRRLGERRTAATTPQQSRPRFRRVRP